MTDRLSFFTRDGADLAPAPLACSMWSRDQMHGVALSGALADPRRTVDLGPVR